MHIYRNSHSGDLRRDQAGTQVARDFIMQKEGDVGVEVEEGVDDKWSVSNLLGLFLRIEVIGVLTCSLNTDGCFFHIVVVVVAR